ncbi:MAG: 2-oxoacid:acceptor oxidoreductase, alpha subunit [Candidatus Methanohalarchaeum thermophilum]|uniref:2-oxoacid:acceptor oxidoreductase, alpha subunit n=1 Tax=Methanohalarchaeum thermophilum TaxID=1903181 RepID=A0A1Q6DSX8_METT1|nr:MAG: 2-oxoacid:acceptor oxidoreductase, alpha subunit [Candidatus Methanohalarchaeum thermophilum]
MKDICILVGGKAGEGVRASGEVIGRALNKAGYYVYIRDDYPSLIEGGHNFSQVHASVEETFSQRKEIDLIGAFDERTVFEHRDEFKSDSILVVNSNKVEVDSELREEVKDVVGLPISDWRKEVGGPEIIENTGFAAAITSLISLDPDYLNEVFRQEYGDKAGINISLAEKTIGECKDRCKELFELDEVDEGGKALLSGNQSILLGAVSAGLDFYVAYPMTPATSILHFAAQNQEELGLDVMQPENEIAVINIALGASFAGKKSMVATSGGGYDLMQETISLAGMSETPILLIEAQRPGPSTGVPTYTSQADLKYVLEAGHGEFPHIVIAPGDVRQAFYLTGKALNHAWRYQTPVTVLVDKHLSESLKNTEIDPDKIEETEPKKLPKEQNNRLEHNKETYNRYFLTEDGVSPLKFPGNDVIVKNSSYEHLENGLTTEKPIEVEKMQEKRLKKTQKIKKQLRNEQRVWSKETGSDTSVITWGSTKGAVIEATKEIEDPISVIQPLYMWPFPIKELKNKLSNKKTVISVEANSTAQLTSLIKEKTEINIDNTILKYNSRPFYPKELAKQIMEVI